VQSSVWLFSTSPSYLQQQPEDIYCSHNVFPAKSSNFFKKTDVVVSQSVQIEKQTSKSLLF